MARGAKRSALLLLGLVLAMPTLAGCAASEEARPGMPSNRSTGSYRPATQLESTATAVKVGLYGLNAYQLDTAANTFYFNGYLWLIWRGNLDPLETLEVTNVVDEADFVLEPLVDAPEQLATGENIIWLKVSGRFFEPFDLRDYPLDTQQLTLIVEDSTNTEDVVQYSADVEDSGLDSRFEVPGWTVEGLRSERLTHDYGSNFGTGEEAESRYSALRWSVDIARTRGLFLWKLLLPLLLVLGTNWLALILHPRLIEVRTAMPATALLTMVFLQQSALDGLPPVSTLVLIDRLYLLAYSIIVATFARMVWDNNRLKRADDEVACAQVLRRSDRIILAIQVFGGLTALWVLLAPQL